MRRDSIFYSLFKLSPALLFDLLETAPESAAQYRFESVAVKEPKFEIDGVFLPPASAKPGTVFFSEFQMQKDDELYERLFSEAFLYFRQNRSLFSDWQAVLLFKSRSTEQTETHPYRALLNSGQVHRIYLDELGPIETLPLGVATLKLTIARTSETVAQAKRLIERAQQELPTAAARQGIIELVSSIVTYRFTTLSRQEVNAMLGISLEKTRVYQEAKQEGLEEGLEEGLRQQRSLILKQLVRRVGELTPELTQQVQTLSSPALEGLGEALLDFTQVEELRAWLSRS